MGGKAVINLKNATEEEMKAFAELQIAEANKQYIKALKEHLKVIKELDPKDRLDLAYAIWVIIVSMKGSIKGWDTWLNFRSMNLISEKDMKKIASTMKELAMKWIQVDIDITQTKTDELIAKAKKRQKAAKKKKKKKTSKNIYVA